MAAMRDLKLHLRSLPASRPSCPDDMPCCIAEGLYVGKPSITQQLPTNILCSPSNGTTLVSHEYYDDDSPADRFLAFRLGTL